MIDITPGLDSDSTPIESNLIDPDFNLCSVPALNPIQCPVSFHSGQCYSVTLVSNSTAVNWLTFKVEVYTNRFSLGLTITMLSQAIVTVPYSVQVRNVAIMDPKFLLE